VTVSIGLVELAADDDLDLASAIGTADRAMYRAKQRGGDCVSLAWLEEPSAALSELLSGGPTRP